MAQVHETSINTQSHWKNCPVSFQTRIHFQTRASPNMLHTEFKKWKINGISSGTKQYIDKYYANIKSV